MTRPTRPTLAAAIVLAVALLATACSTMPAPTTYTGPMDDTLLELTLDPPAASTPKHGAFEVTIAATPTFLTVALWGPTARFELDVYRADGCLEGVWRQTGPLPASTATPPMPSGATRLCPIGGAP